MKSLEKTKISRPQELGPLNLTKTQYRPYVGNFPNKKNKQNLLLMGPTQNIMFDIPQIQQTRQPIEYSPAQKLRIKIGKYFEQKSGKLKQQWTFYIKKSQIVANQNSAWSEVETFLLKIIYDLFSQLKNQIQMSLQLQKTKQVGIDSEINYVKTIDNTKLQDRISRTYNMAKNDCSINQYSNILRPIKTKTMGKSEYKGTSTYSNIGIEQKSAYNINENQLLNHQSVKISKLQKELQLYKQRMRSIQDLNQQKLNNMEKKIQIQLKAKYSQTIQQKMKYQSEVQSKKFYNDILGQQFNSLKKKYAKLQVDYQIIKAQFQLTKSDKNKMQGLFQYRELWLMQYQQILQLKQQIFNLKSQNQMQINKNKGLKQKLKELSKNFNYNYNVSIENQKDKQDLNTVLKDFRDWLKFFAVPRVSKGMMNNNTFFPQMNLGQTRENFSVLLPKDDNTNYKLLRPNFFIYFQAYEGIIMAQRKFPQRKIMPTTFYLTIRAILDAMFLHFNFNTDFKQWLSFPQFVISFIQKFQISLQTKKPYTRKSPCQSQQKINFLLNVFNIQAANTWQCEIFRSFLLQQFTLDQLYFYLQCRDNLLRGSQLNNNFGSSDSILFIKVGIAQQVIKDKLRNYDRQMLERIKKFINSKKKVKNNRQFIDINFVLKLLLQVYSIQKIKSQRFFHHNFKSKSSSTKLSYTEYSAFMSKNFDFLTKGDIAKLYRQIYTLGVSHITYKTIHYVCSMKGLFIPLLRAKLSSKIQTNNDLKYPKMFEDILFLQLQNSLNNMVTGVQQYGVEEIVESNVSMNKLLHDCQKLRINRSNFSLRFLHQCQKILKIKSILAWKNQKCLVYQQLTKDQIRQRLSHLLSMINQSDQDVISLKKLRDVREKAMIKLTKNFKIRIQQSLAEFKVVDKKQYQAKIANVQQTTKKDQIQQQSDKEGQQEERQK